MQLELEGSVAVVIGGAHGIGKAIGRAFAAESASVVLADLDPDVERIAAEELSHDGQTAGRPVDATDYKALQSFADEVSAEFGGCDHLVYAAGVGSGKYGFPFWKLEPRDWHRVLEVNLIGAVNALHALTPQMIGGAGGSVLFLSSIAGQIGSQTDPPYSAAKAGLINFAQCAARDLASYHVRVNTVCPGMVKTAINQSVWKAWHDRQPEHERMSYDAWADDKIKRVAPLGRWQTCEDIAALAVFLASPRAKNITGQTMNVDGGQVMHW